MSKALVLAVLAAQGASGSKPSAVPVGPSISGESLIELVRRGDARRLGVLLKKGLDVNRPVSHGTTLLMTSAIHGKPEITALLLRYKPDLDRGDWLGASALTYAVVNRRKGIVETLIAAGANVNGAKGGSPPLIDAAGYGLREYVDRLLRAGAKVDAQDPRGLTALMMAANRGHLDVVRALLKGGANRELTERTGNTALGLARQNGFKAIETVLSNPGM